MPEFDPQSDHEHEIEHTHWQPHAPRGRSWLPVLLAAAVVAAAGVAAYLLLLAPAKPAATSAPPAATPAAVAPTGDPLPALGDSDDFIRQLAARLSAHPELARWLARTSLVRTLT